MTTNRSTYGVFVLCVFVFLVLFLPLCPFAASKPSASLTLRWQPGVYHLGDLIPFEVSVPLPSKEFYIEGDLKEGAEWGEAVITKVRQEPPSTCPGTLTLRGELQVFGVGGVTLPPLSFNLHLSDTVQPCTVKAPPLLLAALLPPGPQARPAIAAPLVIPAPWPWLWISAALAAIALIVLGASLIYRKVRGRRLKPRTELEPKEVDPDRWIQEEIERIFAKPAEAPARYQRLSEALRDYMSIKYEKPFLEWTTGEVARGLKEIEELTSASMKDPLSLFAFCDLIMFARYNPQPQEEKDAREIALEFVQTIQHPRELEAAS